MFRSVLYFTIGMLLIKMFALLLGLCIYASYEHCDPILAGDIARSDQVNNISFIKTSIFEREREKRKTKF